MIPDEEAFRGRTVLVVGGARFVGGNLVRLLLVCSCAEVLVVDNLLSGERTNIPQDRRVQFMEGSIADDEVLSRGAAIFHSNWDTT